MKGADGNRVRSAERYRLVSIELDCAPGNPRPDDLISGVLEGTGLTVDMFDTASPFFGHQTWILREHSEARDAVFSAQKPVFKERIAALYKQGLIRYGSW